MPRTKQVYESDEVAELARKLADAKARERNERKIDEAKNILAELESEYEHAKEVFGKVNGARRILKNLEQN